MSKPPKPTKKRPSAPTGEPVGKPIHPDVDWQASVLATKVQRKVMGLDEAARELDDWQKDAGLSQEDRVVSRALLVTHMLNTILKRGY